MVYQYASEILITANSCMIQEIQNIFGEKTYICKDRQKSIFIKRGLKLHRSRNLAIDGFWLDDLTLYQK